MAFRKCCVGDCESTSNSHKLFYMPLNDNLRNLWLSFLIPTNPNLLGLTKNQLRNKFVCDKPFDRTQFDDRGVRNRYSYPCLFTRTEILHGVPLSTEEYRVEKEHNYCGAQIEDDNHTQTINIVKGMQGDVHLIDHSYSLPSTSGTTITLKIQSEDVYLQDHQPSLPSTSQIAIASESQIKGGKPVNLNDVNTRMATSQLKSASHVQIGKPTTEMSSKTRRCIKNCIKRAKKSIGDTSGQRLQSAQNLITDTNLMKDFEKLGNRAKTFLLMQLKLAGKNKMARRFSVNEKLNALTLWKHSPKGYKLLENMFALPNKRTLQRLSENIEFECGINDKIFDHIKEVSRGWDIKKKLCALVFDEGALTPRLIYNERKDKINGFVEIAEERKQKLADHALVFMIRGICSSWRQSIAYYFISGTISTAELQKNLKVIIPRIRDSGLVPLAILCDQGSTFRSCFKALKEESARLRSTKERYGDNTVHIGGCDLFLFFDPPHLLKGIRNNFVEKDIIYHNKRATWKDIMYIYDIDNRSGHTRALPRLTAEHVDPKKIKKMKVKAAAQVLSARTAAMLEYTLSVHKDLNSSLDTMETTAAVVLFFDDLFDSVNGSPGGSKGKLRCAVKNKSPHEDFWRKALIEIKNMRFLDTNSKRSVQAGKPRTVRVPSLDGWIVTLESFLGLAKLLFNKFGVEYFYPRHLNQDPLEKFFWSH